jgi:hypothetical protein
LEGHFGWNFDGIRIKRVRFKICVQYQASKPHLSGSEEGGREKEDN